MQRRLLLLSLLGLGILFSPSLQAQRRKKDKKNKEKTEAPAEAKSSKENKVEKYDPPIWAPKKYDYMPSAKRVNDIIHTELHVSFNWQNQTMDGEAILTVKPHFYDVDSLNLDAKGFTLKSVELVNNGKKTPLEYSYKGKLKLRIGLDKTYKATDTYQVRIVYVANPEDLPKGGSEAITDDKGLYFINPDGADTTKPTQLWTQGETQASSCWFPTIDEPNEKMTQDIYMTVQSKYITLSNGRLVSSVKEENGKRTDHWKQDKPHAPYLAMMAVGDFVKTTDHWRGKEVSYYMEPEYAPHARAIFGNTPEMIEFFSTKFEYDYPWDKYSQIVIRDFVSGAMENTSAATFLEQLNATPRELLDADSYGTSNFDYIIAHELFHHWFGDLVTCESWPNLPLNESFANYSEYLWAEYKFGIDEADYHATEEWDGYFGESRSKREPLIRYYVHDRDAMFDAHSYNKGGLTLHMLRNYVGDEAFFKSLALYLDRNEFKPVEIHQLRLAFEEVTGEDLNWFFNQHFLAPGHPELTVTDAYLPEEGVLRILVEQTQDTIQQPIYRLMVDIEIYVNGKMYTYPIVIDKAEKIYEFKLSKQPDLVYFDGKTQLLGEVLHQKSIEEFIFQFYNKDRYKAKKQSLEVLVGHFDKENVRKMYLDALNDDFWAIRQFAVEVLSTAKSDKESIIELLKVIAKEDEKSSVRAAALRTLGVLGFTTPSFYKERINDSSYAVAGAALGVYLMSNPSDAATLLATFESLEIGEIAVALGSYYATNNSAGKLDWYIKQLGLQGGYDMKNLTQDFATYLNGQDIEIRKKGADELERMAREDGRYYVRVWAYFALDRLNGIDGLNDRLKAIAKDEKDENAKKHMK